MSQRDQQTYILSEFIFNVGIYININNDQLIELWSEHLKLAKCLFESKFGPMSVRNLHSCKKENNF